MKKQVKPVLQLVSVPKVSEKKTNGELKPNVQDKNSRTFETRFIPRYKKIPTLPIGLPEPTFSQSSNKILKERYLLKGGNLEVVETVAERFWHIAYDIASGDFDFSAPSKQVLELAEQFYTMMVRQQFLPNSPTIMNAGKQNGLQYSACFVLPVGDSLPEIFDSVKYAALIHQTGGGTGMAFSRLRPAGSVVKTTGGVASGPVSFLRVFNAATESIKQGGTRRGANMGILRVDHPDILEFIRSKSELDDLNKPIYESVAPLLPDEAAREYFKTVLLDKQIANFNISVAVTNKFMEALGRKEDFDLILPQSGKVVGKLNAKKVFDEIIERAWSTGDPGLIFIDRINDSPANPVPKLETIESTNPCGEQPLAPWDACNLGSINLGKFVLDDGSDVDWEGLRKTTRLAVHFLDNVVQTNPYTLKQIYDEVRSNRRIGLGVMGFADMLFILKIPYNSEAALELAEKVMKFINEEGHQKSEDLAETRGPFPNWANSIYADKQSSAFKERPVSSAYGSDKPIRNSTVTTIAPTGTISIIGDCSSGIEPVFALAYIHKAKSVGDQYRILTIANKTFSDIAQKEGFWSEDLAAKVLEHGSVSKLDNVPNSWQKVFVTAPEIDPVWHVKMQAAFQKYTDNGVSKTINLPNSATKDDVATAYLMAYQTGCSGITIYRDGSKSTQVLNISSTLNKKETPPSPVAERPMILRGHTYKVSTPVGEAFITINRDEQDQPFEVFVTVGRAGMHTMADAEAMGRLVSLSLRLARGTKETDPKTVAAKIIGQLKGIGGANHVGFGKNRVMSLADAIAKVLAEDSAISAQSGNIETIPLNLTINEASDDVQPTKNLQPKTNADLCPECGSASFVMEEGCKKCHSCGYSMC
ncbi:adenosylcobalamin-dependent ribonucleoside-diphosphate reductase [Candidatus Daviesbacteria bacterium]|nr:adenosylcobalamin-dependent ribonucleoside-diphosphate reductase [Candidatus Daviesbacteria bacterium]MBI4038635.1 adenosylcobalamin-dependent ribonucleoside-diphosphate reductase [Candidatus Daviesbacteria bacterium]